MKNIFILVLLILSCENKDGNNKNSPKSTMDIYVSDAHFQQAPWQILKYNEFGKNPEVFINKELSLPQDILFLDDQEIVLISNFNSGRITKYHFSTGEYIGNFATGLNQPTRMTIGPNNKIYVLQWGIGDNKVLRFEQNGTALGAYTSQGVYSAIGLDWDSSGNLYVSSYYNKNVVKFDASGNFVTTFISEDLLGPTNIWFNNNDELHVIDYLSISVKKFNTSGQFINTFATGLSQAEGVAFFENGDILIGNGLTNSIIKFNSSGIKQSIFVDQKFGGLSTPNAIVIRKN